MSSDDEDALREAVWDLVYSSGSQSLNDLTAHSNISIPQLMECVDHEWFVVKEQSVSIAQSSE